MGRSHKVFSKPKNKIAIYPLLAALLLLPLFLQGKTSFLQFDYWTTLINGGISFMANLEIAIVSILFIAFGWLLSVIFIIVFNLSADKENQERLDILDIVSLGMSGAPIFLTIVCFLALNLGIWSILIFLLMIPILLILLRKRLSSMIQPVAAKDSRQTLFDIGLFLLLVVNLLLIKQGYIFELEFPLNIDSVNHTVFVSQGLEVTSLLSLSYYHYAIHYVFTTISIITQEAIPKVMLGFGQTLQTIIPLAIFYPVHKITRNTKIALFTTLVVGVGFGMPSAATSWGKYPALTAIGCLVYIFYLISTSLRQKKINLIQALLTIGLAVAVIFIHSRVAILYLIALMLYCLEKLIVKGDKRKRVIVIACLLIMTLVVTLINHRSVINEWYLSWSPYTENIPLLVVSLCLLAFSVAYFPQDTYYIFLIVLSVMIFVALPAPDLISTSHNAPTLIDRPFLSLFLFIPVSLILGLGMLGLDRYFKKYSKLRLINQLIVIFTLYILFFPNPKVLGPLPNSNLVSKNDMILYQMIENTLPDQALVMIPNLPPNYFFGIDGGVWLEYASGLHVVRMLNNTDFATDTTFNDICASGANYIYVGNSPYSFSPAGIESRSDRYKLYLSQEDVSLYKVVGCP